MDFRWIAGITLWTLLIGPIVGGPAGSAPKSSATTSMSAKQKSLILSFDQTPARR